MFGYTTRGNGKEEKGEGGERRRELEREREREREREVPGNLVSGATHWVLEGKREKELTSVSETKFVSSENTCSILFPKTSCVHLA